MTLLDALILLLVAGVCGYLGQTIAGSFRGGLLVAIVLGFIGAMIGMAISRAANLPEPFALVVDGHPFPILWSIIGATLFVIVVAILTRRPRDA